MLNPRTRIRKRIREYLEILDSFLVPLDLSGLSFRRYSIKLSGWRFLVIPKFEIVLHGGFDLTRVAERQLHKAQIAVASLADTSADEIRQAVKRSAKYRAARVRTRMNAKANELVLGQAEQPTVILAKGREAVQTVHRSIAEAAGNIGAQSFHSAVRKSLAQMVVYAREEAGVGPASSAPALPNGTKFVYYGEPYTCYILEERPRVRTVIWDDNLVSLSFPYVVFALYLYQGKYSSMQAFFRNERLKTPFDILCAPALPDVMTKIDWGNFRDGQGAMNRYWVCFPGPKVTEGDPADIAESAQLVFWQSKFREGHWCKTLKPKYQALESFSHEWWIDISKRDPTQVLSVKWLKTNLTPSILGESLKKPPEAVTGPESVRKLDRFAETLVPRLSAAVQEAVVEAVADAKGPAAARAIFSKKMEESVAELKLEERLSELIRIEFESACNDAKVDSVVSSVAKKASEQLVEVIKPMATDLFTEIQNTLRGVRR